MSDTNTICLLNDSFPPVIDGVANAVSNYARYIEGNHGHAVVVTPEVPGAVDAYDYPVLRYPSIDTRKRLGYVTGVPFSPEVARQLGERKAALLHSHCPMVSTLLARELRDVLDAPLVFTYHTKFDIDIARALSSELLQEGAIRAIVENISACDEVWVVSQGAGENLRSLGYEGEYTVMENGVDIPCGRVSEEAIAAATAGYDLPDGVPLFLFVGRLMWYKGLHIILDALSRLQEQGHDFRMVFIGAGGDGEEVRKSVRSQGLEGKCFFTGAISDRESLRAWYCRADLFLFPSTFDTNGLVVREAAACALPSVLIAGSCAAEGVTDRTNGFLIEENAASMASCLTELCAHPERMRSVGQGAERDLYLSWEDAVNRACVQYEIIIDRYRSGYYIHHRKPVDGFLQSHGELMDTFGRLIGYGNELEAKLEERLSSMKETLWNRMDRYL